MTKHLPLVLALVCVSMPTAVYWSLRAEEQQARRLDAEIAADLDKVAAEVAKLAAELKLPHTPPPSSGTIPVAAGSDLQQTINAAPANAVLDLEAGATWTGNYYVNAGKKITLQTQGLALPDRVVTEDDVAGMAKIISPNNAPALHVRPGTDAGGVNVYRVHFDGPANDVVLIGAGDSTQTTLDVVPRGVTLDQVSIRGVGAKNGVGMQGAEVTIRRSFIRDVARLGVESHCIVSWNGPGPFLIEGNYLLGSAIGILFGGATPPIPQLVPADGIIRGNLIQKHENTTGRNYASKNALEWKVGRRMLIEGNTIDRMAAGGQAGWAIVMTPSQASGDPWAINEDWTFRDNVVRNIGGFLNLLGHGQHQTTAGAATLVSRNIKIENNWISCDAALGGHGALVSIGTGPIDVQFRTNTVECNGSAFIRQTDNRPIPGFVFTGNLLPYVGVYGLFLNGQVYGSGLDVRMPGAIIQGNGLGVYRDSAGVTRMAHPTLRSNLPTNAYAPVGVSMVDAQGYGVGDYAAYGRQR